MAFYTYFPRFLQYNGLPKITIQLITTIIPFNSFLFPPIIGKLSDKFQNRYTFFVLGGIGNSIIFFIMVFVNNLSFLVIGMFIYGFFSGCGLTTFFLYQELVVNDPKFISYYNAMMVMGWFVGAQLGGIFIQIYSIINLFVFLSINSFIIIPFVILIGEDREFILKYFEEEKNRRVSTSFIQEENNKDSPNISKSIYYALYFRNFGVRPLMAILAIIIAFHINNDAEIGFLVGINPLIQIVLMILIGRIIADKNMKGFMIIGYILTAFTIFGYIISTDFLGFLFFQIMVSFSYALFYSATHVYIAKKTSPQNKGKYIGYANSSFYLGSFLGGLFFSLLLSFNSDYFTIMYVMIIFPLLSSLIILVKFPKLPKSDI